MIPKEIWFACGFKVCSFGFFLLLPHTVATAVSVSIPFSGRQTVFSDFVEYDTKPSPPPNGPVYVAAGDIDQDGDIDVVNEWNLYEKTGADDLEFDERTLPQGARNLLLTDLNGDDRMDLVCSGYWYAATGPSGWDFMEFELGTQGSEDAKAADLDQDGDTDLVFSRPDSGSLGLFWLENLGGVIPDFLSHRIESVTGGLTSFEAVDFDKDLDLDILLLYGETGAIDLLRNDGAEVPAFSREELIRSEYPFDSFGVADLDSDDDLDIFAGQIWPAVLNPVEPILLDHRLVWYENTGFEAHNFKVRTIHSFDAAAIVKVVPVDIEGDGKVDLLYSSNPLVGWFQNDGEAPPQFEMRELDSAPRHFAHRSYGFA